MINYENVIELKTHYPEIFINEKLVSQRHLKITSNLIGARKSKPPKLLPIYVCMYVVHVGLRIQLLIIEVTVCLGRWLAYLRSTDSFN